MSDLNEDIHTPTRLRIMTTLAALPPGDSIAFPRLRALLGLTAGNLSAHLGKLAEDGLGYVTLDKTYAGRKPVTYVSLTLKGRTAYSEYLDQLRQLLASGKDPA